MLHTSKVSRRLSTAAIAALALGAAIAAAAPTGASANALVNGGFEDGNFTGWTVNAGATEVQSSGGLGGYAPEEGSFYAALGNVGLPLGSISQSFTDTVGQLLTISYYLASNGTTPNEFKVVYDGSTLFDQMNIPTTPYTLFTFNVTGTGSDTLTFFERDDPNYLALDNVSVSVDVAATPLPLPLVLFATGLGVMGLLGWRRKPKAAAVAAI
jgi:hypothetical protein